MTSITILIYFGDDGCNGSLVKSVHIKHLNQSLSSNVNLFLSFIMVLVC